MLIERRANPVQEERRRTPRIPARGDALVARSAGLERARLLDVSTGGVGLRSADRPIKGEPVRVLLALDAKSWLDLQGIVRHVRTEGGAYVFGVYVGASDREALARFRRFVEHAQTQSIKATGRHRLVRACNGALTPPGQAPAASSVLTPIEQPRTPAAPGRSRTPKPAAAPTPAQPNVQGAASKRKQPRTRTLVDHDLKKLYQAAMQEVAAPPKNKKK